MANKGMRDVTLTLDGVNEQRIEAQGDFIHVQAAPNGAIQIRADEGPFFTRFQSQGNRVYYSHLVVKSSVAQTITLQVGYGYATDARASVTGSVFNVNISPAVNNPSQADVACAAGAQTQLLAADANRLVALISVPSNQANGLRIGDNTTAANKGVAIDPGTVVAVESTAAIFAWNAGANPITATATSLRNV